MAAQGSPKTFRKFGSGRIPYFPGTRPSVQNAQLLTSTGIISLDYILGGGLPVGSILLIEEDAFGYFNRVLLSYFMAEGVVNGHSIFLASQDRHVDKMIAELPDVITSEDTVTPTSEDAMTIAWRYQNLRPVTSVVGPQTTAATLGHHFDFARKMHPETVEKADITKWHKAKKTARSIRGFQSADYSSLLLTLSEKLADGQFRHEDNPSQRRLARVVLHSLGSPSWSIDDPSSPHANIKKDLPYFLLCLRALCRSAYCATVVTIPSHLFRDRTVRDLCIHQCDICIGLESFAGSDKETNSIFKDYQGLLHIRKLLGFNTLAQFVPESVDLAFKLKRHKFVIEKLHLPPELQDSAQREQDDGPSVSCGSAKSVLDF